MYRYEKDCGRCIDTIHSVLSDPIANSKLRAFWRIGCGTFLFRHLCSVFGTSFVFCQKVPTEKKKFAACNIPQALPGCCAKGAGAVVGFSALQA